MYSNLRLNQQKGGKRRRRQQHDGISEKNTNRNSSETSTDNSSFVGWTHYFPMLGSSSGDRDITEVLERKVKLSIDYFGRQLPVWECSLDGESKNVAPLNYRVLTADVLLKQNWPCFVADLCDNPSETLAVLSLAMYHVLKENIVCPATEKIHYVRAHLINFEKYTAFNNLRADLFGKLVVVRGTIVRVGNTRPLCMSLAFKCRTCSAVTISHQPDGNYEPPARCRHHPCEGTCLEPQLSSNKNITIEFQTIRVQEEAIQENSALLVNETGHIPRFIDCQLFEDLVCSCSTGQSVIITGIVKTARTETTKGIKENNMSTIYLEAVSVRQRICDIDNDSASTSDEGSTFSQDDYADIRSTFDRPNLYSLLVASVCPSICGQLFVKAGLLLGLLGGSVSVDRGAAYSTWKRSNVHVLLMGDPGLGKSQLLKACCRISKRGVYVCGNSTTNAGLTVTVNRDMLNNGGDNVLEAGAFVLGDRGVCCIDELDKMTKQQLCFLEVMEQQTVSLAKSGIVCSLPARTTILAAANPSGGHYNKKKNIAENVTLGSALLSRFDLIFILLDRPESETDKLLTEHITGLHSSHFESGVGSRKRPFASMDGKGNATEEILPFKLLRKFIAYARDFVHPLLNEGASEEILEFYLELRENRLSDRSTPITPRQLESLVRLSQARAKADLREVVTREDAKQVIEIMKTSLRDISRRVADSGRVHRASSSRPAAVSSLRKESTKLLQVLQRNSIDSEKFFYSEEELQLLASQNGIGIHTIKQKIDILNLQGYLLKKGGSVYKFNGS